MWLPSHIVCHILLISRCIRSTGLACGWYGVTKYIFTHHFPIALWNLSERKHGLLSQSNALGTQRWTKYDSAYRITDLAVAFLVLYATKYLLKVSSKVQRYEQLSVAIGSLPTKSMDTMSFNLVVSADRGFVSGLLCWKVTQFFTYRRTSSYIDPQ